MEEGEGKGGVPATNYNDLSSDHFDVPLVEFMYLVFTRMPGENYRRRLGTLLLYLCYVFPGLINGSAERRFFSLNHQNQFFVFLFVFVFFFRNAIIPLKKISKKTQSSQQTARPESEVSTPTSQMVHLKHVRTQTCPWLAGNYAAFS